MKIKRIACFLTALLTAVCIFASCNKTSSDDDISFRTIVCFSATVKEVGESFLGVTANTDVVTDGTKYFSEDDEITVKYSDVSKFKAGNVVSVTFDGIVLETYPPKITATSIVKLLDSDAYEKPSVFDGENFVQTSPILSENAPKLTFLKNDDEKTVFIACENAVQYNGESIYGESPLMTTGYGYAKKTDDFKFVTLKFEKQPDSYTVRGWKEESIGNASDALKAVNVDSENNIIKLDGDEVVFEITASWNNGDKIIYSIYVGEAG